MKKFVFTALLLIFSCTDMLKPPPQYNSLHFQGGGWIEVENQNTATDISVLGERFSLQFWAAGDEINTSEAPALFSIVGSDRNIKIALFRDPARDNALMVYLNNSLVLDQTFSNLEWSNPDKFYLFTIMSNDTNNVWDCGEELFDEANGIWDEDENFRDDGLDQCPDSTETGLTDPLCLAESTFDFYCENDTIPNPGDFINTELCDSLTDAGIDNEEWDPNSDNYSAENTGGPEGNSSYDEGEVFSDVGNGIWDVGELFTDTSGIDIYLNDDLIFHSDLLLDITDESLILGAVANKEYSILENFWYGYLDEARLWSTLLEDTIITHQYAYPGNFVPYYLADMDCAYPDTDTLLVEDALRGLWRFNLDASVSEVIEDESGNGNSGMLYTLPGYSFELSTKGAP